MLLSSDPSPDQDFLVQVRVNLPAAIEPTVRAELLSAELARGRELVAAGVIYRIWRVPGALANVAVWRAANATVLHDLLTSLPLFLYADISVTALAAHPIES
jgi:muconolactone D-isomerase